MRLAPLLACSLFFLACGDDAGGGSHDTPIAPDADATESSDTTADSDTLDATESPDTPDTHDSPDTRDGSETSTGTLVDDRFGTRLWGAIIGLSVIDGELWIGQRGNPDYMDSSETPPILGGLVRLTIDSGHVTTYGGADIGVEDYEFAGYPGLFGPTATAHVHDDAGRLVVVTHKGLLAVEDSDVFAPISVRMPQNGPEVVPIHLAIARDGLRPIAWMTSDQGLLRLDEDSFVVEDVVTATDIGLPGDFGKLTVDPDTGTVFATFFPTDRSQSRLVRVNVQGQVAVHVPSAGLLGDVVWSAADQGVYAALATWNAATGGVLFWDGVATTPGDGLRTVVNEGALGGGDPFGAQTLALDDARKILAVGGNILGNPIGPTKGGGLAWLSLSDKAIISTADPKRAPTPFVQLHVHTMVFDPTDGRLYAAISDICSETRLRSRGLFALSFDGDGHLRFERPLLSTVRAVAALDDALWVGVRDDNGGLACTGYPMTTGLMQVRAGGVGALSQLDTRGDDAIVPDPGVTALAGTSSRSLAIGTYRDGFYVGSTELGIAGNPAFIGPSLFTEDVLWDPETSTLWLAGKTSHSNGDPPQLADRGPRGAAKVVVGEGGIASSTHYVRVTDSAGPIPGLPTGEVKDLLPDDDGSVLAACAIERVGTSDYDRADQPPFLVDGQPRLGGIARISPDDTLTTLVGPELAPDPRAIAWDGAHALLVADAEKGLLRIVEGVATPIPTPGLPSAAIPRTLWADGDDLALGTSKGLWLSWDGKVKILDDVGWVWAIFRHGDHLLVGCDAGLVIVRDAMTTPIIWPARTAVAQPPFP